MPCPCLPTARITGSLYSCPHFDVGSEDEHQFSCLYSEHLIHHTISPALRFSVFEWINCILVLTVRFLFFLTPSESRTPKPPSLGTPSPVMLTL